MEGERRLNLRRAILFGVLGLAAAGILAPYLSADVFGDRIRQALERALGRRVEIEAVRFNLFRGPGFSLRSVVIHEDPAAGAEPFAYVNSIEARVSLLGLVRGSLEFSALRLEEPSVNLVKTEAGPWNFQPLLNAETARRLPAVSVRNGRLNFKLGGVKSVFYFSQTDLDVRPPRTRGGAFGVEFSGDLTRSDRTARGFGTLSGRGRWRPAAATQGDLELEVNLERSSLGELVTLVHGHDIGVHGQVSGLTTLRGPLSGIDVGGTLQLTDIHRWDLLPPYAAGGPLKFRGKLNLLGQELDLGTTPSGQSTLDVRFRASDYLVHPRWAVDLKLRKFAVPPLVEVARHMGAVLSQDVRVEGTVSGAITYSPESGVRGEVSLGGTSITAPSSPVVRMQDARLVLDGDRVTMPPAAIGVGEQEKATLRFQYMAGTRDLDLELRTAGMSIAALQSGGGPLPGVQKPGFVSDLRGGTWRGRLQYRQLGDAPGAWAGAVELRETQAALEGFAVPIEVATASVQLQGERISVERIEAIAGGIVFGCEYGFRPSATRPHRLACRMVKLRAGDLAKLLSPTLRRQRGFLSRTLRLSRAAVPEWLETRHAQGSIEIGNLTLEGESFEAVRLDFFWDGPNLDVPHFTARALGGTLEGHLKADFSEPEAQFQVAGRIESAAWHGGRLEGDGQVSTTGTGDTPYRNLRAEGSLRLQSATLGADVPIQTLAGVWSLRWERGQPRLQLSDLRLADGDEVWTGQGTGSGAERLEMDLARGDRRLRLAGTLRPLALGKVEGR